MSGLRIHLLGTHAAPVFPPVESALRQPDGLLAMGGDLSPQRLLAAYAGGIFPWFGEGDPLLWWSPDPRCVFDTQAMHVSRSLRKQLRRSHWTLSVDRAFEAVIAACAAPRDGQPGTWIVPAMREAYSRLHRLGHAHSVEVWDGDALVGGIYGVAIGKLFSGESMFSRASGGSKVALLGLCRLLQRHGAPLLDAQVANPHLLSLGATQIPRRDYIERIDALTRAEPLPWPSLHSFSAADLQADT